MSDGMRRELVYLSSYATNRYFIPNWGISVTAAGIFILAMPEQPEKQYSPKRVTPEGISILVKLRQFEKVYCDIVLTADGILTLFICSQSAKQYCPILLIVDGSVTLVTVLQF